MVTRYLSLNLLHFSKLNSHYQSEATRKATIPPLQFPFHEQAGRPQRRLTGCSRGVFSCDPGQEVVSGCHQHYEMVIGLPLRHFPRHKAWVLSLFLAKKSRKTITRVTKYSMEIPATSTRASYTSPAPLRLFPTATGKVFMWGVFLFLGDYIYLG